MKYIILFIISLFFISCVSREQQIINFASKGSKVSSKMLIVSEKFLGAEFLHIIYNDNGNMKDMTITQNDILLLKMSTNEYGKIIYKDLTNAWKFYFNGKF